MTYLTLERGGTMYQPLGLFITQKVLEIRYNLFINYFPFGGGAFSTPPPSNFGPSWATITLKTVLESSLKVREGISVIKIPKNSLNPDENGRQNRVFCWNWLANQIAHQEMAAMDIENILLNNVSWNKFFFSTDILILRWS